MTCLSRNDYSRKDIFKKVKKPQKNKRRNFYNLVDIKDGKLVCQHESHELHDVCVFDRLDVRRKCTLKNSNNEFVELNFSDK